MGHASNDSVDGRAAIGGSGSFADVLCVGVANVQIIRRNSGSAKKKHERIHVQLGRPSELPNPRRDRARRHAESITDGVHSSRQLATSHGGVKE